MQAGWYFLYVEKLFSHKQYGHNQPVIYGFSITMHLSFCLLYEISSACWPMFYFFLEDTSLTIGTAKIHSLLLVFISPCFSLSNYIINQANHSKSCVNSCCACSPTFSLLRKYLPLACNAATVKQLVVEFFITLLFYISMLFVLSWLLTLLDFYQQSKLINLFFPKRPFLTVIAAINNQVFYFFLNHAYFLQLAFKHQLVT